MGANAKVEEHKEYKKKHAEATSRGLRKAMSNGTYLPKGGYSRTKGGKRADLNNVFFRSSWEANYARYLNWLISIGEIAKWEFEPEVFEFHAIKRGSRFYMPDFKVYENNGSIAYHEVKGWMDQKSKTKLKRFAKYYPEHRLILIDEPAYKAIAKQVKGFIPHWE